MKFMGLSEIFRFSELRLTETVWREISLEEVIEYEISSLSILSLSGISWTSAAVSDHQGSYTYPYFYLLTRTVFSNRQGWGICPGPIAFFDGEKTRVIQGLVIFCSMAELVEFLVRHIDPAGPGILSEIKSSARRPDGTFDLAALEENLGAGFHSRRRRWDHDGHLPLIFNQERALRKNLVPVNSPAGLTWAWKPREEVNPSLLLACKSSRRINDHNVPVLKFILPFWGLKTSSDEHGETDFLIFDGERIEWRANLSEVPFSLLEEIERDGTLHCAAEFDLLPQDHLEPICLVRIPPGEEMKSKLGGCVGALASDFPPHPLLARPGYLLDSCYTIALPEDLPVLDDPAAAVHLLCRVTRGIYIPNRRGRNFPLKFLPEQESYQVLCRPRSL